MTELTNKTLAQIVTDNHRAAFVFEKYHLDFCCRGKRTLEQACQEQQILPDPLIEELNSLSQAGNGPAIAFNEMSLQRLSDYIVDTHHAYVKNEAPQLLAYLRKIVAKHGERHPELNKIFELFAAVREEMDVHMQKEELVLFPRIRELEKLVSGNPSRARIHLSYLLGPINVVQDEHDHAGRMMEELRQLSNDFQPPADACTTYRLSFASLKAFEFDLHQHVHLENNILFPRSIALFRSLQEASLN